MLKWRKKKNTVLWHSQTCLEHLLPVRRPGVPLVEQPGNELASSMPGRIVAEVELNHRFGKGKLLLGHASGVATRLMTTICRFLLSSAFVII